MERLEAFLRDLCAVERVGGRTRIMDGHTLELSDVQAWPHGATEYVREHGFPDVVTHIRHSRHSLTGFVVIFTRQPQQRTDLAWYMGIAVLVGVSAYVLACTL